MKRKQWAVLGLTIALTSSILVGCNIQTDTPIIGRIAGLKSNQIFQIDKLICEEAEYRLVFMDTVNRYRKQFGSNVDWEAEIAEDKTLKEYVMDQAKEEVSVQYALASMANAEGIKLTDEEHEEITEYAKEYFDGLSSQEKEYVGAGVSAVTGLFTSYKLADKVYTTLTEKVGEDVSEEEARVIQVQYIRISKSEEARKTLEKVIRIVNDKNWSFSQEAKRYTQDQKIDETMKKNEIKRNYEKEAFRLKTGQISKVIEEENDYYLVYCVNSYDETATTANKNEIVQEKREKYFQEKYDTYLKTVDTDFNTRAWKDVEVPDNDVNADNLMEIYGKIE